MIGKKNIVFGFLFLVITAALGPYMITVVYPDVYEAQSAKQDKVGKLQLMQSNDFEIELEPLSAGDIAKNNTSAILSLNSHLNQASVVDEIKGGPHAHGNLEALLNIAAGLVLCFIAAGTLLKQLISWAFILGTLLHSGLLYVVVIFEQGWAGQLLGLGVGPILILVGLLMTGIVAVTGFKGRIVED
jgi:hypothetical protein